MGKKVIKFGEFMSGDYKVKAKQRKQRIIKATTKLATASILPLATGGTIGTIGFAMTAFACTTNTAIPAMALASTPDVPASVGNWAGQASLQALTHILDPVVDVLVALSLPIASVVIVGSCFYFMFGKAEKAWGGIQNAGLGYVLIQVSPLILNVLKQVGNAV